MLMAMGNPSGKGSASGHRSARLVIIEPSRCPKLLEYLEDYPVEIQGLADLDLGSPVVIQAKKRGLFVTQDYPKLLELADLDLIINLSPDKTMQMVIEQLKPEGALVIQASESACLTAAVREWILNREFTQILKQLAKWMAGTHGAREALVEILKSLLVTCNAHAAGLWLRQGDEFVLFLGEGLPESLVNYPGGATAPGALGILLEEKRVVVVKDLKSQTGFPDRDMFMSWDIRGLIMVPMVKDGEVTGALLIMTSRPVSREPENLTDLFQALVQLVAETLEMTERVSPYMVSCTRDEMTGLYNEIYLRNRLEDQIAHAWRKDLSFSLLCIKMIPTSPPLGSKEITLPRAQLRKGASEVVGAIRKMDVPARSKAGDFFIVLVETRPAQAFDIARRILSRLERVEPRELGGPPLRYALGVACFPEHGTRAEELLEGATWAAERAASEGPGKVLGCSKADPGLFLVEPHQITRAYPSLGELFDLLWGIREVQKDYFDHARGVAYYAGRLGQSLGLDEHSVLDLQISGWLHDIGKIGIFFPKGELGSQFPRLAEVDRNTHAAVGAFILKNFVETESILRGVLHHHDRFDGADKFHGKKGEAIPLEGRIIALANVYQHLLFQAGPSQGRQWLFCRLRELAGKSLDPQLVECLIRSEATALDRGWKIRPHSEAWDQRS